MESHFQSVRPLKRALISVSDKTDLIPLAKAILDTGAEILSTGGTAKALKEAGLKVTEVSDYTSFPEMMDGRVKTLHPMVHGGLLMRRGQDEEIAKKHGIQEIDMVVINLYPFEATIARAGVTGEEAIEQIDIGGPAMLRSASKNFQWVTAITDTKDYSLVIDELKKFGGITEETRKYLAITVFERLSSYDKKIAEYLRGDSQPELLDLHYEKVMKLRYGENPHQKAAFFRDPNNKFPNVTNAKVLQGKELSYNNIVDADAALELVKDFDKPAAAVIKHTNPCGVATAENIDDAFTLAFEVDPMSAFGCVIALNDKCTEHTADYIEKNKLFVEIIIAPSFDKEAIAILGKKTNLRLLETGPLQRNNESERHIRSVSGGLLIQTADDYVVTEKDLKIVTEEKPNEDEIEEMLFARVVVKHVKSNSVIFAKKHDKGGCVTTGIGAGQMSRVDSVIIAKRKGGDRVKGSVMASDAFFPFPDAVEEAASAGIHAVIQPGGSIRDEEVTKKANELKMAMVFTGIRSFRH